MKFLSEYRDQKASEQLAQAIWKKVTRPWTIMEICGGQTHTIVKSGLEDLLPREITLVHGPAGGYDGEHRDGPRVVESRVAGECLGRGGREELDGQRRKKQKSPAEAEDWPRPGPPGQIGKRAPEQQQSPAPNMQKGGILDSDAQRKPGQNLSTAAKAEIDYLLSRIARSDRRAALGAQSRHRTEELSRN